MRAVTLLARSAWLVEDLRQKRDEDVQTCPTLDVHIRHTASTVVGAVCTVLTVLRSVNMNSKSRHPRLYVVSNGLRTVRLQRSIGDSGGPVETSRRKAQGFRKEEQSKKEWTPK